MSLAPVNESPSKCMTAEYCRSHEWVIKQMKQTVRKNRASGRRQHLSCDSDDLHLRAQLCTAVQGPADHDPILNAFQVGWMPLLVEGCQNTVSTKYVYVVKSCHNCHIKCSDHYMGSRELLTQPWLTPCRRQQHRFTFSVVKMLV